jgi:hypothetical protein
MRNIYPLFLTILIFLSCERKWDNILDTDEDLINTPNILQIEINSNKNITIILDYSYSDMSTIILERKSVGAFEKIDYIKQSQSTLLDTTFDKEINHFFVYRVQVKKGEHSTYYSNEESIQYTSTELNAPTDFLAATVEMQGIHLSWQDKSNNEEGYLIERNDGNGYFEIVNLPANSQSHFDPINNLDSSVYNILYRVRALNSTLVSQWVQTETIYPILSGPDGLQILNITFYHFTIQWNDKSGTESNYSVERSKDNLVFEEISLLNNNTTQYIDSLNETGLYKYRVRAKQNNIFSSYSNEVNFNVNQIYPIEGLDTDYPYNGNANDESGNGNDGEVYGATLTMDRFGNVNSAFSFDGVDDYIIRDVSDWMAAEYTTSIWVKAGYLGQTAYTSIFNNFHTPAFEPSDDLSFQIDVDGNNPGNYRYNIYSFADTFITFGPITTNWQHLLLAYKGTNIELYLNGNLEKIIITQDAGKHFRDYVIGRNRMAINYFNGIIDDVRIYTRALNLSEIQALYHEGEWSR